MTKKKHCSAYARRTRPSCTGFIGQYNRYVASIIRAVLGKTCREEDAEELTADVFYSVFRRAGSISAGKLQAYLGAAAPGTVQRIFSGSRSRWRQTLTS